MTPPLTSLGQKWWVLTLAKEHIVMIEHYYIFLITFIGGFQELGLILFLNL
jgi:hypothetical protein